MRYLIFVATAEPIKIDVLLSMICYRTMKNVDFHLFKFIFYKYLSVTHNFLDSFNVALGSFHLGPALLGYACRHFFFRPGQVLYHEDVPQCYITRMSHSVISHSVRSLPSQNTLTLPTPRSSS